MSDRGMREEREREQAAETVDAHETPKVSIRVRGIAAPSLAPGAHRSRRVELVREVVLPIRANHKPGRNDLCACGSGRKFKRCCGRLQQ